VREVQRKRRAEQEEREAEERERVRIQQMELAEVLRIARLWQESFRMAENAEKEEAKVMAEVSHVEAGGRAS
jgi:hypothetical protein